LEEEQGEKILIFNVKDISCRANDKTREIEGRKIFQFNGEMMISLEEGNIESREIAEEIAESKPGKISIHILFLKNKEIILALAIHRFSYKNKVVTEEKAVKELLKLAKKFERKKRKLAAK